MDENPTEVEVWSASYRFASVAAARRAYEVVRDYIFGEDVDASVYRVMLNGASHVVAISEAEPSAEAYERIRQACRGGGSTVIPDEIVLVLAMRRAEMKTKGERVERRYSI